jgi:molecular chaperone HscB
MIPTIKIDNRIIERRFKDLQKQLHPDLFTRSSKVELEISCQNSMLVNKAYQTLKHPMERLKYILKLNEINVLDESSESISDPELLITALEIRERISSSKSVTEIEEILGENRLEMDETLHQISNAFSSRDFRKLANDSVRLQYFSKIDEEARAAIETLS